MYQDRCRKPVLLFFLCTWGLGVLRSASAAPGPTFVGRAACAPCHADEMARYAGSHHDLAMQPADASTVLGDFNGARFSYNGVTSLFSKREGKYFVRTEDAGGKLREFPISFTFGAYPLQQYLVRFPDGRLQALSICWDTRPKSEGGQRWFHLYPGEKVDHRDVLHWTGPAQNWNYMCAECHSTDVRRNYDAAAGRFDTRWSEIDVSCEACHGPGSAHVEWARLQKEGRAPADPTRGLPVDLSPGPGSWLPRDGQPIAELVGTRDTRTQVDACGRCHSRRSQVSEDYRAGDSLAQTHIVSLLDEPLYDADGQIRDEVYEYGSFLQSRMHARGVACTDCHDPHSGKPRAEGNRLCASCHQPAVYDSVQHHHHPPGAGTSCVNCHMRQRNYMVVHRRHDHSFRVPRPDLASSAGSADTCVDCHRDRTSEWAAEAVTRWYGPVRSHGATWGPALAAGRRRRAGSELQLERIVRDPEMPAIVRATAVGLLGPAGEAAADALAGPGTDPDPLLRRAAVGAPAGWSPQARLAAAVPLLDDPVRTVRLEAVDVLADVAGGAPLSAAQRQSFDRAVAEYRAVQALFADRAESWMNLGVLEARLGNLPAAESAYRKAITLQPHFLPSYVNLSDLLRATGRDADGEKVLRQALALHPEAADVRFTLGLLLVRQKRTPEAVVELGKAAELDAQSPRYAYVFGVALDGVGRGAEARRFLEEAHRRFSGDRDILAALSQFAARDGDTAAAEHWGRELRQMETGRGAGAK